MAERTRTLRVSRLQDQGSEDDLAKTTPAERIEMVWPLTLDAWSFKEPMSAESRLQRHIVRILRRKG
jgi:hypothetical protein